METRKFAFIYPTDEIFNQELSNHPVPNQIISQWTRDREHLFLPKIQAVKSQREVRKIQAEVRREQAELFRPTYSQKLNSCINHRYRKNNFQVYWVSTSQEPISSVVQVHPEDHLIDDNANGKTYANPDFILDQILPVDRLVLAGFHLGDCVERIARRAHKRRINVLVDEDLTEFFAWRLMDPDFRIKTYPTYNPQKGNRISSFEHFMRIRKGKPWLYQDYV